MSFQRMFRIPCDRMLKHLYPGLHMRSTERHGDQESRLSSCSRGRRIPYGCSSRRQGLSHRTGPQGLLLSWTRVQDESCQIRWRRQSEFSGGKGKPFSEQRGGQRHEGMNSPSPHIPHSGCQPGRAYGMSL